MLVPPREQKRTSTANTYFPARRTENIHAPRDALTLALLRLCLMWRENHFYWQSELYGESVELAWAACAGIRMQPRILMRCIIHTHWMHLVSRSLLIDWYAALCGREGYHTLKVSCEIATANANWKFSIRTWKCKLRNTFNQTHQFREQLKYTYAIIMWINFVAVNSSDVKFIVE